MREPMRLLFVIKSLAVPGGGAERAFVEVVNELSARGHVLEIATFDHAGQKPFYHLAPHLAVYQLGASLPGRSTPRFNLARIASDVRRIALTSRPDAIVSFMHSTYVPVALGLAGTSVPLILSEHTSAAHFANRPLQRALVRLAQHLAYAKAVVSQQVYDEHPIRWRSNLYMLPNPVDLSQFARGRCNWPGGNKILCIGGLRPEKDQKTLIAAFDRVAAGFPDWSLRLVGDGVDRPQIESRVSMSPYSSRIELPGVVHDVATEYKNAKFIVMPSTYESLGMVAIEAMASGRAVIGFGDCAGALNLIRHGENGLLVDPGGDRVAALADALRKLMANDHYCRKLGSQAPSTVERYSVGLAVDQWENLLSTAGASRREVQN